MFGEPDVKWHEDAEGKVVVEVLGVDVFDPRENKVRASGKGEIAAWFIDTDYDATRPSTCATPTSWARNDPYKSLKTTLRDEIDARGLGEPGARRLTPLRQAADGAVSQ